MAGTVLSYRNITPTIGDEVFLADGVYVIGDVEIGPYSSIWYNSVVRGDVNYIRIGEMTNVQDGSVLHVTREVHPLHIGNSVTVGHKAMLHGCTLQDLCLIGIGSIVLDGAVVESYSMVAAGAVVTPNTVVETGTLVGGIPARKLRNLSEAEMADLPASAERYYTYSRAHAGS
jgi:carbonic anhydrase/acetyltransferase-like protein (isoleucine patch superfamily)